MWITLTNTKCIVRRASEPEKRWLRGYLSYDDTTAYYRGSDKSKVAIYNSFDDSFPAGLLSLVKAQASKEGFTVDIGDARTKPDVTIEMTGLEWLREYQVDAIKTALVRTRGIWHMATGAGKTEAMIGLVRAVPIKWLLLVNSYDLVKNAANRWTLRTGEPCGIIGDGLWSEERFTCATFQTMALRLRAGRVFKAVEKGLSLPQIRQRFSLTKAALLKILKGDRSRALAAVELLSSCQGLLIDEGHTAAADSFWTVAQSMQSAYYRIAVSATPLARSDMRSVLVASVTGSVIHKVTARQLIDAGYLSEPTITFLEVEHDMKARAHRSPIGHPSEIDRRFIVNSKPRNAAVIEACRECAKPALCFVLRVGHGRALTKQLEKEGMNVTFVHGDKNPAQRDAAIAALRRGETDIVVATNVFATGIDIPEVASVVNACGDLSTILSLQRLGRGSRIVKDSEGNVIKDSFQFWDILDTGFRTLETRAATRMSTFADEGYTITVRPSVAALAAHGRRKTRSAGLVKPLVAGY